MQGAEPPAILEILQQAQHHHDDGGQNDDIGMCKVRQRTDQRDDHAGCGNDGEAERIDLAALNERRELFAVKYLGHGNGSLLGLKEFDGVYIRFFCENTC